MNKTLKVYQVNNIYSRIKNVIENKDIDIKAKFKFKLLRLYSEVQSIVKDFEITKDGLINKYGTDVLDSEGNVTQKRVSPDDKTWTDFVKEINTVAKSDVDIDITPITVDELFEMELDTDALADLVPIVVEE